MANNDGLFGGGFHHVALRVTDLDAAVAFYKRLGFTEKISFQLKETRAVLLDMGNGNYVEIFSGGAEETPSEGRVIHFAIRTPDCAAAHAKALEAGAVETSAPRDLTLPNPAYPVPIRFSFVKSPSGEIIEFFQNELT